jgi:glutamate carboxypeptidase
MPATPIPSAQALLSELETWVRLETPTTDAAAINRLADLAAAGLTRAGAVIERVEGRDGFGDHILARTPGEGPGILLAGHLDTVWDHGTLADMPFTVRGDRAAGPGIYDMKAGSFLAFFVTRAILAQAVPTRRPITLLLTSDEEVGSPTSRWLIEREAARSCLALIPEPAGAGGACVTSRKGVGRFTLRVEGKGAHAGGAFESGASAVVELAHQILALHGMVDLDDGITLNAAPVWGGSRPNVISPDAGCEIDLRVNSARDGARMEAAILGLSARTAGCAISVTGGMNRPPYAETEEIRALYDRAREMARGLGMRLPRQHRGGGSDGNFIAAMGVPTLDGLGCPGSGAHAHHEHILWEQLAPRAALLAELLENLD